MAINIHELQASERAIPGAMPRDYYLAPITYLCPAIILNLYFITPYLPKGKEKEKEEEKRKKTLDCSFAG